MNELKGKVIKEIYLGEEYQLFFVDANNEIHLYTCFGDCCSESWWREIYGIDKVVGKVITDVTMISTQLDGGTRQDSDIVEVYNIKCDCYDNLIVEHRNSSNGYYSGSVDYSKVDQLPENAIRVTSNFIKQ